MNVPDSVVVVTYPGHCLTTVGTLDNLFSLTDWTCPVHVFIDDQGLQYQQWQSSDGFQNYTQEFRHLLEINFPDKNFFFHHFSDFHFDHIWDGWLRQQMVKLNLDQTLSGEIWYVTDGDVKLSRALDCNETPFNFLTTPNHLINIQNENYMKHMLGINDARLRYHDQAVFSHLAPFRWVHREHLQGLRRYVGKRLVNDFNLVHIKLMREEKIIAFGPTSDHLSMTEWDLLEVYKQKVLGLDLGLKYWLNDLATAKKCDQTPTEFWTFFGTDKDLDRQQFQKFHVPESIWQNVQKINRT